MTEELEVQEIPAEEAEPKASFALLIELEHVVANTRTMTFDVLTSILKDKKITIRPVDFMRYSHIARPEYYLEDLLANLGAKKLSATKLADDIESGVKMGLTSAGLKVNPGISTLVDLVKSKKMVLGAVTSLSPELSAPLLKQIGLGEGEIELFSHQDVERNFPRADIWLKVAKKLEIPTRNCTAIATSAASCKAALTAGMRCIALPDTFTAYQDFGGAYTVIDSLEDIASDDAFSMID